MALELILTARNITAPEAQSMGLVNRVVPADALMKETLSTAKKIATMAPAATTLAKGAVCKGINVDLAAGCHMEKEAFGLCFASSDAREGTSAFLEKRKPGFSLTR